MIQRMEETSERLRVAFGGASPVQDHHHPCFVESKLKAMTPTTTTEDMKRFLQAIADTAPKPGVEALGHESRMRILQNLDRLCFHLDLDGTLTEPGQPLSKRAIKLVRRLQKLGVPMSCNTAQSYGYMVAAGGNVFGACVNELGMRIQHCDGRVVRVQPPNVNFEWELARDFLQQRPHFNVMLFQKDGGISFKFANQHGKPATAQQIQETLELVRQMVSENDELSFVHNPGRVDIVSAVLSKRFGASEQMTQAPFKGCFAIGAGDGATDERMFEVCELSIKVGSGCDEGETRADSRVGHYVELLDVLEWIADLREMRHGRQQHKPSLHERSCSR